MSTQVHRDPLPGPRRFGLARGPQWEGGQPIGQSPAWIEAVHQARQVAATETSVCLYGESGTGKEVLARLIHRLSPRRDRPFVAVNCAALPDQLLESEMFGYERGAFTGAQTAKAGLVEVAWGGVLFLDEVVELSAAAQAKFLRVLQEREFRRLGGTRLVTADIRVIAATNRDLGRAVQAGAFREDLFYRLQVFDIHVPPLRERKEDIPLLCEAFLEQIRAAVPAPPAGLSPEAAAAIAAHDWPGNLRELRNVLERAAILCGGGLVAPRHLVLRPRTATPAAPLMDLRSLERGAIEQALQQERGNKVSAARRLGLTRTQLQTRLRKHGLLHEVAY
jgi:two-component system NtrC family response regulator